MTAQFKIAELLSNRLRCEGTMRLLGVLSVVVSCGIGALALSGCATIGPAVPQLSSRVGDRLAEMRSLHELAIRRMFDGERLRVDAFVDEKWTPAFLRNYVGISDIVATVAARRTISEDRERDVASALRAYLTDSTEAAPAARAVVATIEHGRAPEPAAIRRELDRFIANTKLEAATNHLSALLGTDDPGRELIEWARHAEHEIQAERASLHAPIDEAEDRVLTELTSAYDELAAAQGALTARVQAAAKLKQLQDDGLKALGLEKRFTRTKVQALKVGVGVGKALGTMEKLDHASLLNGTKLAGILRDALAPEPAILDSTTTR